MPLLPNVPAFLQQLKYQNPSGASSGVFQYSKKIDISIWEWLATEPELFRACNEFMEGNRGSRTSWVKWYPVQEQLLDGFDANQGDTLMVDIAGGYGHDVAQFRETFPQAPGRLVLEDLPMVINAIGGLHPSIEKVAFDFFTPQVIVGRSSRVMSRTALEELGLMLA